MGIFDIIGPVMIGPSSSHTAGAARIGQVASRILGEPIQKAHITLYGSFAKTGKGHGTDRALVAGLMGYAPDSGSIRDALTLAKTKGIQISFSISDEDMGHPNVAKIDAYGTCGAHVVVVGRSLGGGRVMIPGIVADVCRFLAKEHINISTMRLFRKGKGDEAVMIIHTDQLVPQAMVQEIVKANDNILYAMSMDII